MIRGGFFNSLNGDRLYNAADMNIPYKHLISDGVIPSVSSALQVMANSGMTINVSPGAGLFGGGWAYNDADEPLTITPAHSTLDRIDLVVIRRDDNENVRAVGLFVKAGTPGSSPIAPTVERSTYIKEYALAEIRVKAQAAEITQSAITDTRPDSTRCGWATGLIQQVDTSTLFAQWEAAYREQYNENMAAFAAWWADVRTILINDETAAAEILLLKEEKADRNATTVTLPVSGWALNRGYYYQTVNISGLSATDIVIISAASQSIDTWGRWGVICTAQGSGTLTFRATAAVEVVANILNLGGN